MDLLTKVNYAIMRAFFSRPIEEQTFTASPVDNEDLARAVIDAIAEPTEEMIERGDAYLKSGGATPEKLWAAMVGLTVQS